jgi:uroporphyrin-3 C-methyltransferase
MSEEKENKAMSGKDPKIPDMEKIDQNKTDPKKTDNKGVKSTSQKTSVEKTPNKKVVAKEKSKSANKFLYFLIVVIVVAVSAAFVFLNNRLNKIENNIQESNAANNSVEEKIDNRLSDVLSRFSSVQKKQEELELKQEFLSHSISQPVEQQVYVNEDYALAEIEHLLTIANYNLQLDHNVATALSAMEAVDARLKGFTNADALSAREQLIADMNELRSLNQADLSGMALYLSGLIRRVDDLQLKENVVIEQEIETNKEQKTVEPAEDIKHFLALVFEELKSLVVITRDTDVGTASLLPDEVYFLRANLKLELANARFAVFNRDTDNLHMSIGHLQSWLKGYFDLSDANVRNIFDSLSTMKKTKLEFPELDINSSLESVRALSRIKEEHDEIVIENAGNEEAGEEGLKPKQ